MNVPRNANDIIAKYLVGAVPGAAFEAIGIHDAEVVRPLPTELPKVEIRDEFIDIMFELADGRLLHLEFQTTKERNLYRFLHYDAAIAERYRKRIRTVVLYTRDVTEAPETLDIGCAQYRVENLYLSAMDGDAVLDTLERHLATHEWTEADRVRLAFAFHMRFVRRSKDEAFEEIVDLVRRLPERDERNYLAALILGFSARRLMDEQKRRLMEVLKMTEMLREIEQEARQEERREIAKRLFRKGASVTDVMEVTGLSEEEAEEIRKTVN